MTIGIMMSLLKSKGCKVSNQHCSQINSNAVITILQEQKFVKCHFWFTVRPAVVVFSQSRIKF